MTWLFPLGVVFSIGAAAPVLFGIAGAQTRQRSWLYAAVMDRTVTMDPEAGGALIQTLEGEMRAETGDWIIKGVKGEIYSCKDEIFRLTYEPVEAPVGA